MFGEVLADRVGPFRNWVERKDGILVYSEGERYGTELSESRRTLDLIRSSRQRGSPLLIPDSAVAAQNAHVAARRLRSNDSHVLALARASEALVLCTAESKLREDFLDSDVLEKVGRRRRSVYPLNASSTKQRKFVDRRRCPNRQSC